MPAKLAPPRNAPGRGAAETGPDGFITNLAGLYLESELLLEICLPFVTMIAVLTQ